MKTYQRRPKKLSKEEVYSIVKKLSPKHLRTKIEKRIQQKKQELLATSYSYEDLANKYHVSARSLREYIEGKKIPRLGKTITAVELVKENYVFDADIKRWFPKAQ
jgi:hypothetical protein